MPYPINRSDGSLLVNIPDYTRDTITTSLTLLGRGVVDYGEGVAENFVHLMEHFAGPTPPAKPLEGQVWFHTFNPGPPPKTVNKIKVWNGVSWVVVGGVYPGEQPPTSPELGDLWYNITNKLIYYWDGTKWVWIGAPPTEPPKDPEEGMFWWTIPERQLWSFSKDLTTSVPPGYKRADGTPIPPGWVLIGPMAPADTGTYFVYDSFVFSGNKVDVIKTYINDNLVSVFSNQSSSLPEDFEPGFLTYQSDGAGLRAIKPGLNMNNAALMLLNGTATNADLFDGLDSNQFIRRDRSDGPAVTDQIDLGTPESKWRRMQSSDFYGAASTLTTDDTSRISFHGRATQADSLAPGGCADRLCTPRDITALPNGDVAGVFNDFDGTADIGGTILLTQQGIDKIKGQIPPPPVYSTNYIKTDGDSSPTADNTFTVGSAGAKFKQIYSTEFIGTASTARYADLAERYEADAAYAPGTVLKIGGSKEVTQTTTPSDMEVFGVVSTAPAYLMNSEAGKDDTHPPVALMGRVPVRIIGKVTKGQRLVSANVPGCAAGLTTHLSMTSSLAVIGRALEDKTTDGEGLVMCALGMK